MKIHCHSFTDNRLAYNFFVIYLYFFQTKPGLTDPIEYEAFIMKKKSEINHDSLRDLLVFPQEDVVVSSLFFNRFFEVTC